MPTLNPQLKISTSSVRDLSKYRHEVEEENEADFMNDDSDYDDDYNITGTSKSSSSCNKDITFVRSMRRDNFLRRKVNELRTHGCSNLVQRNASDTSLLWSCGEEDEIESNGRETSTKLDRFNNAPERVLDPSLVPGNLRNARVRSAFQIMEELLSHGSAEPTQENSSGKTESQENSSGKTESQENRSGKTESQENRGGSMDFLNISQIKAKRKPARFISPKQQINKQKERINSTVLDNHTSKLCNIYSKSVRNSKLSLLYPAVEDRLPRCKGFPMQGKVNSDLSIDVAPYPQNSSNDQFSPYQSNSSAARIKNFKRAANSFERVVRRKASQGEEQMRIRKLYRTKIQSNGQDVVSNEQSGYKHDRQSSCDTDSVLADIKLPEARHQIPKPKVTHQKPKREAKAPQRERTNSEENKQRKPQSKVMRYELKKQQRREIYALNKVMTDLENERFALFMQDVSFNNPSI